MRDRPVEDPDKNAAPLTDYDQATMVFKWRPAFEDRVEKYPKYRRSMIWVAIILFVIAFVLILVAALLAPWIQGTEQRAGFEIQTERKVGLFRECYKQTNTTSSQVLVDECSFIPFRYTHGIWKGARALVIVVLILLIVAGAYLCAGVTSRNTRDVHRGQGWAALMALVAGIATLLIPLGYIHLDRLCPIDSSTDEPRLYGNCRLQCARSVEVQQPIFDFFLLCPPFSGGFPLVLHFIGFIVLCVGVLLATCVKPEVRDEVLTTRREEIAVEERDLDPEETEL
eukprot:m.126509 g.126509  ORF g.126509 m.126509 type:complete len:283 (-) comp13833_c0_seq2:158-1006(-)